jgi:TfoX N-terminal domain
VARGEGALQRRILICQRWICTQPVTEAQATLELHTVIHQMEVVGAMRSRGIAQKAPVGEGRIEYPCILVAVVDESSDWRRQVVHERDDVDDRLGEEPGDGSGADVMNLQGIEQRLEPFALRLVESRPCGVIRDELDTPIADSSGREVAFSGCSAVISLHRRVVFQRIMAYDEDLANRIRELIAAEKGVTEKRMFGGLAFLIDGHMSVSVSGRGGLMLRCDPAEGEALRGKPHAGPFEMRGRVMDGWLRVDPEGVLTKRQLERWVARGVTYARSLPPKG